MGLYNRLTFVLSLYTLGYLLLCKVAVLPLVYLPLLLFDLKDIPQLEFLVPPIGSAAQIPLVSFYLSCSLPTVPFLSSKAASALSKRQKRYRFNRCPKETSLIHVCIPHTAGTGYGGNISYTPITYTSLI